MNYSESPEKAIIKHTQTNDDGVKFYNFRIQKTVFDHSPKNPSLPVVHSREMRYLISMDETMDLIDKLGFKGEIIYK